MSLRTAPCPQCQSTVVFGEPQCRKCQMVFDYGPSAPPRPTGQQIQQALLEAAASALMAPAAEVVTGTPVPNPAARPPTAAPAAAQRATASPPAARRNDPPPDPEMAAMLDTGRFEDVGNVPVEDVPGFVDSRLFAAYTPANVPSAPMEGLERASAAPLPRPPKDVRAEAWLADERAEAVGDVPLEDIPGLVDSRLFGAYTPANVPTETIAGLEVSTSGSLNSTERDVHVVSCLECGTPHELSRCPACGTPVPETL